MDAKETLIRIVLLTLLLYAAFSLASARRDYHEAKALESALRSKLETTEKQNLAVSQRLAEGWNAEELAALAWERLGLVLPGERVFRFESACASSAPR